MKKLTLAKRQQELASKNYTRACVRVEREKLSMLIFANQEKELRDRELDRANNLIDRLQDTLEEIESTVKQLYGGNNLDQADYKVAFSEVLNSLNSSPRFRT